MPPEVSQVRTRRLRPPVQSDGDLITPRGLRDGTAAVQNLVPTKQALVEDGSYFVVTNPTPESVLAYGSAGTQATYSDTVPFMQIINTGQKDNPAEPVIYPDYLKVIQIGTAPATTTSVQFALKLDNAIRTATGGTPVIAVPVSPNMGLPVQKTAGRVVYFTGAVATIPAATTAARLVGRGQLKGGPTLNLDEYTIAFGVNDVAVGGGYLTTVSAYTSRTVPLGIGPGQSLTVHLWFPGGATNPFSYEFEFGYWER